MNNIKVSVIIPVYQVENFLERAIDSVLNQTLKEIEIILVDDGSIDNSPAICDEYKEKYPDIIKVIHKENQGLGYARNSGVEVAQGEYIAFIDSDDTIEPTMYEEMYEKALENNYDLVMCDVNIIWVESGRNSIVATYQNTEIDLADYLAKGNNITYSVNKLYKRNIWNENKYEKMLFEDIALIPSLVTKYPHIGYVKKAFYNYFRRENTISTSFVGDMVDIVSAFRKFINNSDKKYREEVIYCTAKQMFWNMTKSRIVFKADFVKLLKEFKGDFLLNSYIKEDKEVCNILKFIEEDVIPNNIIFADFEKEVSKDYLNNLQENFPDAKLFVIDKSTFNEEDTPINIQKAFKEGRIEYVEEYLVLKKLYQFGGIIINKSMMPNLNLRKLRLNKIFFGFQNKTEINTGCYGALPNHYVVKKLLDTYEGDNIYNKAYLPLKDRLRDFLIINFGLKINGKKQILNKEIQMYLPSILSFDMKNGENCCKWYFENVQHGYEVIDSEVLELWSEEIINNWNLYKKLRDKSPIIQKHIISKDTNINDKKVQEYINKRIMEARADERKKCEQDIQRRVNEKALEVSKLYESSTCWKLTKPFQYIAHIFGK